MDSVGKARRQRHFSTERACLRRRAKQTRETVEETVCRFAIRTRCGWDSRAPSRSGVALCLSSQSGSV